MIAKKTNQPVTAGRLRAVLACVATALLAGAATAEDFFIEVGDVDALIAAIVEANGNGEPDVIHLAENSHYLLENAYDTSWGGKGLPDIESEITIEGNGATIERSGEDGTPNFRFFHLTSSSDSDLTLKDLTLDNGSPSYHGGAILNWGGTVALIGCTLSNNTSTNLGGAIQTQNSGGLSGELTIIDSTLIGNTGDRGGAINKHGSGGSVIITDSIIADNVATGVVGGGGLYIESSGTHTITGTVVSGNQAIGDTNAHGGGIRTQSNTLTVTDCTFDSNAAGGDGGGIRNNGALTISGTTFSGNAAGNNGGGLYASGTTHATNCTVSSNTAGSNGGGMFVQSTTTLTNCTVAENSAENLGGGIYRNQTLSMSNTIVAYNAGGADVHNGFTDLGYNIVEDGGGISEETSMSGDPMLGPLADNGGPTMTHALLPGSPALVNGDCAGGEITFDQRGMPRPQCNFCDIGAFEFAGLPSFGDLNCDGSIDGADLAVLLGQWGPCDSCREPDDCSADLDGNCQVDGADLAILLGNWSQ